MMTENNIKIYFFRLFRHETILFLSAVLGPIFTTPKFPVARLTRLARPRWHLKFSMKFSKTRAQ